MRVAARTYDDVSCACRAESRDQSWLDGCPHRWQQCGDTGRIKWHGKPKTLLKLLWLVRSTAGYR